MEITILATVVALVAGIIAGKFIFKANVQKVIDDANSKASQMVKDARAKHDGIKKEKILEAKEKFIQLKSEFEDDVNKRKQQLATAENKMKQKDQNLSKQVDQAKRELAELDSKKENLDAQLQIVARKKEDLEAINKMINKNTVKKKSFFSKLDPQSILLFFMYILGFVYYGSVSFLKWLFKKLKLKP